jgi:hypothetical protein
VAQPGESEEKQKTKEEENKREEPVTVTEDISKNGVSTLMPLRDENTRFNGGQQAYLCIDGSPGRFAQAYLCIDGSPGSLALDQLLFYRVGHLKRSPTWHFDRDFLVGSRQGGQNLLPKGTGKEVG